MIHAAASVPLKYSPCSNFRFCQQCLGWWTVRNSSSAETKTKHSSVIENTGEFVIFHFKRYLNFKCTQFFDHGKMLPRRSTCRHRLNQWCAKVSQQMFSTPDLKYPKFKLPALKPIAGIVEWKHNFSHTNRKSQ